MGNFQENLKYYRERAGYEQAKQFAEVLNIPYTRYIAYESKGNEPKYDLLCKIAKKLNVSIDQLLGFEKDNYTEMKNIVEQNKGFKVVEKDNGSIILEKIYNQDIEKGITRNLKKMHSGVSLDHVKSLSNLTFCDKVDFLEFMKNFMLIFDNDANKMRAWNDKITDFHERYYSEKTFKQCTGLDMSYTDIQLLPSATREEAFSKKSRTDQEKKDFIEYLRQFIHHKKDYNIPKLVFTKPMYYRFLYEDLDKDYY